MNKTVSVIEKYLPGIKLKMVGDVLWDCFYCVTCTDGVIIQKDVINQHLPIILKEVYPSDSRWVNALLSAFVDYIDYIQTARIDSTTFNNFETEIKFTGSMYLLNDKHNYRHKFDDYYFFRKMKVI